MFTQENQGQYLVVLEKGEKVSACLTKLVREKQLQGGQLSAIGALCNVELGYYNAEKKEYLRQTFSDEDFELISMNGNISLKGGEPYVHVHGSFGRSDFSVFGGHVFEAEVAVTFECYITPFGKMPCREHLPSIGLDIICRISC